MLKQQPEAYIEVVKGEPLVLTIKAEGESPMSYKWFKGAQELKYCSESVLRVKSASTLDNGQYCCTVSNNYGSVLSDVVLVKVILQRTALPPITQPGKLLLRQFSFPTVCCASIQFCLISLHTCINVLLHENMCAQR